MRLHRWCSQAASAAVVIGLAGAARPAAADTWRIGWPTSVSVRTGDDDCDLRVRVREKGRMLKVESNGCYDVAEAEDDITRLEPGRYFRAEERRWGRVRKAIEIEAGRDGTLEKHFRVEGKEQPFDAQARDWLAEVLQVVTQYSGVGLEQHIKRVLARDGIDGALREIERTDSDHAQRRAYLVLMQAAGAGPEMVQRIASEASRTIDSSYELAELVCEIARTPAVTPAALAACADAAHAVDSSYELRRALTEVVGQNTADASVVEAVLRAALGVDSSYERTELLRAVTDRFDVAPEWAPEYFEALRGVDSDYEAARALDGVLERKALDPSVLEGVAAAVQNIDSDFHKAQVLEHLARKFKLEGPARDAYMKSAKDIDSEYHRRQAMEALLDHGL